MIPIFVLSSNCYSVDYYNTNIQCVQNIPQLFEHGQPVTVDDTCSYSDINNQVVICYDAPDAGFENQSFKVNRMFGDIEIRKNNNENNKVTIVIHNNMFTVNDNVINDYQNALQDEYNIGIIHYNNEYYLGLHQTEEGKQYWAYLDEDDDINHFGVLDLKTAM
ncbi:MAG: hypothetical protein IJ848_00105 [Alphaproteobacteria bacterium]|nr:hypothetical protein [Alphaproteobacteria bacterium]